jgi:HAE1 family hydrophobic/amphiphilic exporter-1
MKDLPELKQEKNFLGKITALFVDRFKLVYLLIFTLLMMGLYSYMELPKESIPDVSFDMIVVTTPYAGAGPDDINNLIVDPMESKLKDVDGAKSVNSTIENGYGQIIVEFEENTDLVQAESQVRNEIDSVKLPDGAQDPIISTISTGEIPIFQMTVTGDYELTELKSYAEELKDEMENVKGIRQVDVSGGYEREIQVIADFPRLREYGIGLSNITQALQGSNISLPAGDSDIDGEHINIRIDERFQTIEDIENLVVSSSSNGNILLRDVAEVRDHYKTPDVYSRVYIREESHSVVDHRTTPAVYISVYRETGYDMIQPAAELRAITENAPGTMLPDDVRLVITADHSEIVKDDLTLVINNAAGGLISVIIVLFIFIGLNEALIVSTVIPISLLITFIVMKFTGLSFNTISLTGFIIALGLLVDNAIVVMENVDRLREEGVERVIASKVGTNQVAPAILAATLTTVGAFVPMTMLPGIMGQFLSQLPKTIIVILIASLFVSIIVTPTLCAKFLTPVKKLGKKKSPKYHRIATIIIFGLSLMAFSDSWQIRGVTILLAIAFTGIYFVKSRLEEKNEEAEDKESASYVQKYRNFIYNLLANGKKKVSIILILIVTLIASVITIPLGLLKVELLPYEEPSSITIKAEAPVGTMLDETSQIAGQIEKILYPYTDIDSFTTTVGDDGTNKVKIEAELREEDERVHTGRELKESLRKQIEEIPGAEYTIELKSSTSKMQMGAAISLGLKGRNLEETTKYAEMYYEELLKIDGIVQPKLTTDGGVKELVVDIDPNKASFYGLDVSSIASEVRSQISGKQAGIYKEDGDEYDISLYYTDDQITSQEDFDKIFFQSRSGELVNFNDVAELRYEDGLGKLKKEDGDIVVYVEADVMPGYNSAQINRQLQKAVKDIELPRTVEQVVGGQMEELNNQIENMSVSFLVAIALIYIVLVVQFNSLVQPVVILASVPFSIIGAIVGLLVTGNNLGFYAMFGVVALAGIAVNDAIVLIDFANYLRKEGMELRSAVAEAVKTRFQPVIATSLTTIAGVLPLALFNAAFSQLGYALIFGLVASTILTLLIVPILYYGIERRFEKKVKK